MALFVEELGVRGPAVPFYAGIAVASSSLTSALMAPIWGSLADRYGRKPMMLRASIAMTLTMGGIAFVPSVFWLLLLRLLMVSFQALFLTARLSLLVRCQRINLGML